MHGNGPDDVEHMMRRNAGVSRMQDVHEEGMIMWLSAAMNLGVITGVAG